jgi:competence protein ComEA
MKPYLNQNQERALAVLLAAALLICGIILFPLPRTPADRQLIPLVGAAIIKPLFIVPPPVLVNINSASVNELITLLGIEPVLAERIIAFRNRFGPFTSVDDLRRVRGIGVRLLREIRDQIVLTDCDKDK